MLRDIIDSSSSVVLRGSIVLRDSIKNDSRGSVVLLCVVKVMTCSVYTYKQVALELRGSRFSSL
jgi:hypothetical protein